MQLRICIKRKNFAINSYYVLMAILLIAYYLIGINVPSIAFLMVAVIPAIFGTTSELLACVVSFIPISAAVQYKYALLISIVLMLVKNRWRVKSGGAFLLVLIMMVWELLHFACGYFSLVEYARDFAELLFMGALIMIDISDLDHKMIIRSLSIVTVGVCIIMFIMQLQQYSFNILKVFDRSAADWRFGQGNMHSGRFALNFDANILGFICNLSTCGLFLLGKKKEYEKIDIVLTVASLFFAIITLSRAAIVCMLLIITLYVFAGENKGSKRIIGILSVFAVAAIVGVLVNKYLPAIFENLLERFRRKDIWNGRGNLFRKYMEFVFLSPAYLLFGIGMQGIVEKVSPIIWVDQVPHNGLQEALVVWGIPGVIAVLMWVGMIVKLSKLYSGRKREFYQYVPLLLTLVFVMSVQLLTESRTLLALSFSYICLCISGNTNKQNEENSEHVAKSVIDEFVSNVHRIAK